MRLSEDDYYATLDDNLQHGCQGTATGANDLVASLEEWHRMKKALLRWIADQDAEWDEQAVNNEHGID